MNPTIIRQAAEQLLKRAERDGDWINTTDLCRVLLGREPTVEDWHIPPSPELVTEENVGPAWQIVQEMRRMAAEQRLEYRGHKGWRLT